MKMKALMRSKVFKITLTLVVCGVSAFLLISPFESESEPVSENQVATVHRGDLTIDITSSGNLELSLEEDLAFEMSGTVEEILVEEGESVEEGQLIAKLDTSEWEKELTTLERELLQAEINLENAEYALDKAEEETTTTITGDIVVKESADPQEIDIKELQVKLAEARLDDAQAALAEALDASPEITAPFHGFITRVNVSGGDEVKKGTVAVQLADPNKFEADILVSEMDIFEVKLGGKAKVQVDAMPAVVLPAKVTHISPTATIQAGVVNYKVKVEIQSFEAMQQEQREARQEVSPGELPERLRQAIEEGQLTQEQVEEMMKQSQQRQEEQQGQISAMIPEDFQLREGLTVTVSIIVEERNDVALVPNGAITIRGRGTYVQVLKDSVIEERLIKTGISNWQYTEITDGLSEGEQVVIPQAITTTPTTTSESRGPLPFMPGPPHPRPEPPEGPG